MHIVLGATGHVGSALAKSLLDKAQSVTVVTHDQSKVADWIQAGAKAAVCDIHDVKTLHTVFNTGSKLFLLNPPAPPSTDTVKEEKRSLACILKALEGSSIRKVVGESTYGAQPGSGQGDLNVLFKMEKHLRDQGYANSILRAAYYMSNWDFSLQSAMEEGVIYSLYPEDFKLPMVAPDDLGGYASELMLESNDSNRMIYVEGPERYSPADVAQAFAKASNMKVNVETIPEYKWISYLQENGFSEKAAKSMAAMTKATLEGRFPESGFHKGSITLDEYIEDLVATAAADGKRRPKIKTLEDTL